MAPDDPTLDLPQPPPTPIPGARAPIAPPIEPLIGPTVGPYRILSLLGEGGFGSVYLAEQPAPVKRRVALKVIKPGMDSRAVVARFEAERQALALMDHPGVAKVYDAGVTAAHEGGRPYFAMELVRGESIARFCENERLNIDDRIRLMVQVCEAVQHAHMKGIIHRDLKPSNILVELVDRRPVAKVIDFGVAKALTQRLTDSTVFTEHGQMIGTPEYMAPEQARGSAVDVDTRADVYSLGAILYQLLTGVTPLGPGELRAGGYAELQRRIEHEQPPRPSDRVGAASADAPQALASLVPSAPSTGGAPRSIDTATLSRRLRGELDWIVMKCLEKERSRRYDSATALARDLERFLADEPVEAGPPSASYRAMKFVKRHRGAVTAAGAVAIAMVVAVAGTGWGMAWAVRERERATALAAAAEEARAESEAVTGFLVGMLESVEPGGTGGVAGEGGGRDVTVREVLDEASRAVASRFAERPLVEARLRHTIANSYSALGRLDDAEKHLPAVVETRRRELGETHPLTLSALANLASLHFARGRYDEAERLGLMVMEGHTAAAESGATPGDGPGVALLGVMNNLAQLYSRQGRADEAEALQRRVVDGYADALGETHAHTLGSTINLASMLERRGRIIEAESLLLGAVDGWRLAHGDEKPGTLLAMSNLAMLYDASGRSAEAEGLQRRVLAARERILGPDHPDTVGSLSNLALILSNLGRAQDAEEAYARAWERSAALLGEGHPTTLTTALNLTTLYEQLGWPERSAALMPRLLATLRGLCTLDSTTPGTLNACAWLLLTVEPDSLRDAPAALAIAERACAKERAAGAAGIWEYLDTLALAQHRAGNPAAAARSQREAITLIPPAGEEYRAEMQERLAEYEAAAAGAGGNSRNSQDADNGG